MNFWGAFLGNFLIGLREGLEAALVVGILLAYIRKTQRTHLLAPMWAGVGVAVLLAALSVGREGLETTLFIWSATRTAGKEANATPMLGALVGIAIAIVMAWGMMRGMMRINLSRFFMITGAFLVIVAAGVLSYGIHDLQEAGILPGLNSTAFESYRYIDPSGFLGTLLKAVFNLSSTTTWLEAGAWILYVGIVMPLFIRAQRPGLKAAAKKPETEKATA